MTEENKALRLKVKEVENIAIKFLHSQPEADEACNRHLLQALAKIAEVVGDYRGLVEVECSNIVWDTDGKKVDLPEKVRLMMECDSSGVNIGDIAAKRLSDEYGWCIKSLEFEILQ